MFLIIIDGIIILSKNAVNTFFHSKSWAMYKGKRMQGAKDNEIIRIDTARYEIAVLTDVGDRDEQQDSYGLITENESAFFVLCDGMGGYQGGRVASRMAVKAVLDAYEEQAGDQDPIAFLQEATRKADELVSSYEPEDGSHFDGGTTLISALVYKHYLFWNSVGDSRIYLFRGKDEYTQLTQDQNYRTVIDGQLRLGTITEEEYHTEEKKANALINYIGIGDIELIDYNHTPFLLNSGDRILLTTDGLYRLLEDRQIAEEVLRIKSTEEAVKDLKAKTVQNAKTRNRSRDNVTMILIRIK